MNYHRPAVQQIHGRDELAMMDVVASLSEQLRIVGVAEEIMLIVVAFVIAIVGWVFFVTIYPYYYSRMWYDMELDA